MGCKTSTQSINPEAQRRRWLVHPAIWIILKFSYISNIWWCFSLVKYHGSPASHDTVNWTPSSPMHSCYNYSVMGTLGAKKLKWTYLFRFIMPERIVGSWCPGIWHWCFDIAESLSCCMIECIPANNKTISWVEHSQHEWFYNLSNVTMVDEQSTLSINNWDVVTIVVPLYSAYQAPSSHCPQKVPQYNTENSKSWIKTSSGKLSTLIKFNDDSPDSFGEIVKYS